MSKFLFVKWNLHELDFLLSNNHRIVIIVCRAIVTTRSCGGGGGELSHRILNSSYTLVLFMFFVCSPKSDFTFCVERKKWFKVLKCPGMYSIITYSIHHQSYSTQTLWLIRIDRKYYSLGNHWLFHIRTSEAI